MVSYQVRVYDTTGALKAVLSTDQDIRSINIEKRVNYADTLTLGLYEHSDVVQYLTLDALIEVRRRVPEASLAWYTEFIGFHRTEQHQLTNNNTAIYTSYSRGLLDLINRRSIRYCADTAGAVKGPGAADDIIKTYVRENAGSLATVANGRLVAGVTTGLAVDANSTQAATISTTNPWKNLLTTIRELGRANKVDFDVLWGGVSAPTLFTFRTYYPQLGTDRRSGTTDQMVFSPSLGNMTDPSYTLQRTDEISSVLVLGPGESTLRDTTLRTSVYTDSSPWNTIEQDQDASGTSTTAGLNQIGDQVLYDKRPAVSLVFGVIQNAQSTYGKHYFLGDVVTGGFDALSANVKIRAVSINVSGPAELLHFELEEVPA